jgi:large subunit ribosomal protein L6
MSRVGKLPIKLAAGVSVRMENGTLIIKGAKNELKLSIHPAVNLDLGDKEIKVTVNNPDEGKEKALWGLFRNLINNMVIGVTDGFQKKLEIKGVGYRAVAAGNKLTLSLGFSHQIDFPLPAGISAAVDGNFITISGADKQVVGEVAAQIRRLRKPEPYKGKGVKYVDEVLRRKAGKAASK